MGDETCVEFEALATNETVLLPEEDGGGKMMLFEDEVAGEGVGMADDDLWRLIC